MFNFPLAGSIAPSMTDLPPVKARKPNWRQSLFDKLMPDDGLEDPQKEALMRQGLLQAGLSMLSTGGGFGNALGQSLQSGLLSMNQGVDDIDKRKYRRQMIASQSALPTEFRSADMIARAAGYEPGTEEYKRFMRVQGGLEGRASSAGFGFDTIKGADGRERVSRRNPRTGAVEVYDEASGDFMPLGGGAAMPAVGGAPAAIPGVYIDPSLPPYVQAEIARAEAAGQQVPDTISGNAFVRRPANPGLGVSRAPEEQAARTTMATEQSKIDAFLANAGAVGQVEAQNAAQKVAAETAARASTERQQEAIADLPGVIRKSDEITALLDEAINHPGRATATGKSGFIDPRNATPGTDAMDFRVRLDQIKGKAFLQAFESLKGGGAITQIEGEKASAAIARLNTSQSDEEFERALRDLQKIAQDAKENALRRAQGGMTPSQLDRPQPRRVKFNPATGRIE